MYVCMYVCTYVRVCMYVFMAMAQDRTLHVTYHNFTTHHLALPFCTVHCFLGKSLLPALLFSSFWQPVPPFPFAACVCFLPTVVVWSMFL